MKILILICAIYAIGIKGEFVNRSYPQLLDHFNILDTRTWEMYYFVDESSHVDGGPIFIYVGDSFNIMTPVRLDYSSFMDIGREMGAYLVGTEHRFYGVNRPTTDTSVTNLQYLTTAQALADMADLIQTLKTTNPTLANSKVILGGVEHGGALATWMRRIYGDLIDGVWASSATVLALGDFGQFHENFGDTLRMIGGSECYNNVATAFNMIQGYVDTGDSSVIEQAFRLCGPFHLEEEFPVATLFAALAGMLSIYTQRTSVASITRICSTIDSGDDEMSGLADWVYNNIYGGVGCIDIDYDNMLNTYLDINWDTNATVYGGRQLAYQYCNEFGWFKSSSSPNQPFGNRFPARFFYEQCEHIFPNTFNQSTVANGIANTNYVYGGIQPQVTNVYFTNGGIDPGRTVGILQDLNPSSPADIIPWYGNGADFNPVQGTDTAALRAVRERARQLIFQWVN